jgi:pilin isopeptide linkage protein
MRGKHSRNRKNRPLVIVLSLAMIFSAMTAFWSFGEGGDSSGGSTPTVTSSSGTGTENQTGSTTSNGTEGDGSPSTETNKSPVSGNSLVPGTDSGTQVQSSTGAADNKASDTGEEWGASSNAEGNAYTVIFDPNTGMHSIPNAGMILYCMNNKLVWPHEEIGVNGTVPTYYKRSDLDSTDFSNNDNAYQYYKEHRDEFKQKLAAILYAGYPINGLNLYNISNESNTQSLTEEQCNNMLNAPTILREAFPDSIGDHIFTYENLQEGTDEYKYIQKFLDDVRKGVKDEKNLTTAKITSMPFYKLVFLLNSKDGLKSYPQVYSSEDVSVSKAVMATNSAVWKLMADYKVNDNDISTLSSDLANNIYNASTKSASLGTEEPVSNSIKLVSADGSDPSFKYKNGKWYSGKLKIHESGPYTGLTYTISCSNGDVKPLGNINQVTSDQEFILESDTKPENVRVTATSSEIQWIKSLAVFSPSGNPDITKNGTTTHYQNMIGVEIGKTTISTDLSIGSKPASDTGTLTLNKIFDGAGAASLTDSEKENLSFDIKDSSGKTFVTVPYKDFTDGSCKIEGIPVGTYTVQEKGISDKVTTKYIVGSKETQKITISKDGSSAMTITNTYPDNPPAVPVVPSVTVTPASADLRVQKLIIGNDGNWPEGASFTMNLQAKDNAPMPNGTVNGVKSITVSSESPASFGTIQYEKAGTYHYIVTESKGSDKNFTYDETQHPVTVTVTESADHKLTASISGGNSSGIVEISNHYTKPKEDNGGKEENSGGNKTNGSTNNSSGKNSSGGSKTNGSTSSKTNGQVQPANTKTLKNSLAKTNPSGSADSSGNASGFLVRTGDQTDLAVMIALLLTSACGLAGVLALKKKRRDDRTSEDRQ